MEDFKRIIEQLRQEKYFLYDVIYTSWDNENISTEDNLAIEHKTRGHRNLVRVLLDQLKNGIMIRPTKADIHFRSYKMKTQEQQHEKMDNKYDYNVQVDFERRVATPTERMSKLPHIERICEDFERIFRGNGWQFDSGE